MFRKGEVIELYGSPVGVHNPREYQHIDLRSLGAQQGAGAGIRGGAGGQDVVDQDHTAALDVGAAVGSDLERALHIAGALRPRQPCCSVARTRRSASAASFTPVWREITRASAPDWL